MADLKRHYEKLIKLYLSSFPAVLLIGARQVGKTHLARSVRKNWKYFDLEKPSDYDLVTRDIELFFDTYSENIIVDETQESDAFFRVLRGIIDEKRNKNGRFILSGSSSPDLLSLSSESLAGRVGLIEVGTLKASEYFKKSLSPFYDKFKHKITTKSFSHLSPELSLKQIQQVWLKGGYPGAVLPKKKGFWNIWMENYFQTYINRDIRKLFPKLDMVRYRRFLSVLAKYSGQTVNKSQIAAAVEISEPVINDYFDIAHGTFLWRKLNSYESSADKILSKSPKGYIRDTGLLHYLLRIDDLKVLLSDPMAGFSFESFVTEEILKGLAINGIVNWTPSFYRTRNKAEIDLILHGSFGILPIEIKLGRVTPPNRLFTLKSFVEENNLPLGLVINCASSVEWLSPKILQIPVGCI